MESYILLMIILSLSTITFFISTFICFSKSTVIKDKTILIIMIIGIIYLLTQRLFISHINAFKIITTLYLFASSTYRLLQIKYVKLPSYLFAGTGVFIALFILPAAQVLSIEYINVTLIFFAGLNIALAYYFYKKNQAKLFKELLEIEFIQFISMILLGSSKSYYLTTISLCVLVIYLLAFTIVITKYDFELRSQQKRRLDELEHRFSRTVEFEAKKRTSAMVDKVAQIQEKSQKDPMTKAYNRSGLTHEINNLIKDPSVKMFSLAIFDIDNFKTINDTKGHIIGDDCLKFLAYTFLINNRKTDLLGRYGGDEFILIMPHVNAPAAIDICERMRKTVQSKSVPPFTISMGIATYPYDGRTFTALLETADRGLYRAKEGGRNRVAYEGNVFIRHDKNQS